MKIAIIGKFAKLYDEEYIARSFEALGHEILRLPDNYGLRPIFERIKAFKPELVMFTKLEVPEDGLMFIKLMREAKIATVCWLFDLYWGYPREHRIASQACFRADYVFTTDGGNQEKWQKAHINHQCVRQGIYKDECFMVPLDNPHGVVFVGGSNPVYPQRQKFVSFIEKSYQDFRWFGKKFTDELRGTKLNDLYSTAKIVVGDSVYSPNYWSNRVVETLGRGGFLIHQDVPGLTDEFPHIVTYRKGEYGDLRKKIDYYLNHEKERLQIVKKNFEWVKQNYTMEKKCAELLKKL